MICHKLRIVCWNILADAYARNQQLSYAYNQYDLSWSSRFSQISAYLKKCDADVICLQEVDHYEDSFKEFFQFNDYTCLYYQRPEKNDGCLIAFKQEKLYLQTYDSISFDDLANMFDSEYIRNSYKKKNVAIIAHLRLKTQRNGDERSAVETFDDGIIITNCHLYWNPIMPNLKLAQSQYLMDRLNRFMKTNRLDMGTPNVITGDFNSLPESQVYKYFTQLCGIQLPPSTSSFFNTGEMCGRGTKFLCDHSLSRLCRWMRVLGIDTAIQSTDGSKTYYESMKQTTKLRKELNSNSALTNSNVKLNSFQLKKAAFESFFAKAKSEQRVILTTSRQLIERSNCPQSLLVPSSKLNNLELTLAEIVQRFSLELNPDKFLTVCGKCGGEIEECDVKSILSRTHGDLGNTIGNSDANTKISRTPEDVMTVSELEARLLQSKKIQFLPTDRPVYACVECQQPYWWNDKESSSPARAMRMADRLYKSVQARINSTISGTANGTFDCINGTTLSPTETIVATNYSIKITMEGSDSHPKKISPTPGEAATLKESITITTMMNQFSASEISGETAISPTTSVTVAFEDVCGGNASVDGDVKLTEMFKSRDLAIQNKRNINTDDLVTLGYSVDPAIASSRAADVFEEGKVDLIGPASESNSSILCLRSCYAEKHGREPDVTNWCEGFKGTLDYLFVSSNIEVEDSRTLPRVVGVGPADNDYNIGSFDADEVDVDKLEVFGPQPSDLWPSDHFMVLADFIVRRKTETPFIG